MSELQFIVVAFTSLVNGKKENTNSGRRNNIAAALMNPPYLPRDQRREGSASPRMRLSKMHPMEIRYALIKEATVREVMAFRAVVEPTLISARRIVTTSETITA